MNDAERALGFVRVALDNLKAVETTGHDDVNADILEAEIALRRALGKLATAANAAALKTL